MDPLIEKHDNTNTGGNYYVRESKNNWIAWGIITLVFLIIGIVVVTSNAAGGIVMFIICIFLLFICGSEARIEVIGETISLIIQQGPLSCLCGKYKKHELFYSEIIHFRIIRKRKCCECGQCCGDECCKGPCCGGECGKCECAGCECSCGGCECHNICDRKEVLNFCNWRCEDEDKILITTQTPGCCGGTITRDYILDIKDLDNLGNFLINKNVKQLVPKKKKTKQKKKKKQMHNNIDINFVFNFNKFIKITKKKINYFFYIMFEIFVCLFVFLLNIKI